MEGFTDLIRLLCETFIGECLDWRDAHPNDQVQSILALVDGAGITPIPVLRRRANTVNGRGVSLWVAVQSLAQLDGSYGHAGAYALREGMRTHVFYRPADMVTASHLEQRVGRTIVQTHSQSKTRPPGSSTPERNRPGPAGAADREYFASWRGGHLVGAASAQLTAETAPHARLYVDASSRRVRAGRR